jgi:hypothetical protein
MRLFFLEERAEVGAKGRPDGYRENPLIPTMFYKAAVMRLFSFVSSL